MNTDPDYQGCQKLSGEVAIAVCDRAIASGNFGGDDLAQLYYARGWERGQRGEADLALADYNTAISINPKHASAYLNRCTALKAKKDYAAAIRDCTTAVEINPELAAAYNNRGTVYSDQENYDRAIQEYSEAIRLDGKYALAYTNRRRLSHEG